MKTESIIYDTQIRTWSKGQVYRWCHKITSIFGITLATKRTKMKNKYMLNHFPVSKMVNYTIVLSNFLLQMDKNYMRLGSLKCFHSFIQTCFSIICLYIYIYIKKRLKIQLLRKIFMGWERFELPTSGLLFCYETYALANCATIPFAKLFN